MFVLLVAFVIALATSVALIESRFPAVRSMTQTMTNAGTFVCIRKDDGSLEIDDWLTKRSESLLDRRGVDPSKRIVFYDRTTVTSEAPPWGFGSAQRATASMQFVTMQYPQEATGGPLTPAEEVEVLRYLQRHRPNNIPALLRNASATSVTATLRVGMFHNLGVGLATLLLVVVLIWGAWRIVRCEMLYRRCWESECHGCGRSLHTLAAPRCLACRAATGPRLSFVNETVRLARRSARWCADAVVVPKNWRRWWRYSGWALAVRLVGCITVYVLLLWLGAMGIESMWPKRAFTGSSSGRSMTIYRMPDGASYVQTSMAPTTPEERLMYERAERAQIAITVKEHAVGEGPSSTGTRYELTFKYPGGPRGPITEADRSAVIAAIVTTKPAWLPTPLIQSNGAAVTVPYPPGESHNLAMSILNVLTLVGLIFAIVLTIKRYRPGPDHPECANCGYSRVGLASDRCPECGVRW